MSKSTSIISLRISEVAVIQWLGNSLAQGSMDLDYLRAALHMCAIMHQPWHSTPSTSQCISCSTICTRIHVAVSFSSLLIGLRHPYHTLYDSKTNFATAQTPPFSPKNWCPCSIISKKAKDFPSHLPRLHYHTHTSRPRRGTSRRGTGCFFLHKRVWCRLQMQQIITALHLLH